MDISLSLGSDTMHAQEQSQPSRLHKKIMFLNMTAMTIQQFKKFECVYYNLSSHHHIEYYFRGSITFLNTLS